MRTQALRAALCFGFPMEEAEDVAQDEIFKEMGVKKQHCYVRKDREFLDLEKFHWVIGGVRKDHEWSTEMNATTYQFPSNKMIQEAYKIFTEETWKYIEQHPDTRYEFCYETKMNAFPLLIFNSERELENKQKERFRIYIDLDTTDTCEETYYFIILDTKMSEFGTEFLPKDWQTLKSWKNGKKDYRKKK
jgi:hypothetical protein